MYLSRLTLLRSPDVQALGALLEPAQDGQRMDAQHRLIWSAFAGDPQAKRDFLWRELGAGRFMVLSPRPPQPARLFEPPEVKRFAPALAAGDRLSVLLRANATRTIRLPQGAGNGTEKKVHVDVVMDALKPVPSGARAEARGEVAQQAGADWLRRQGTRAGFTVESARVEGYRGLELPARRGRPPRFGVLDLAAEIVLTDPAVFLARLSGGFGRAKAFGCGLMLIRPA